MLDRLILVDLVQRSQFLIHELGGFSERSLSFPPNLLLMFTFSQRVQAEAPAISIAPWLSSPYLSICSYLALQFRRTWSLPPSHIRKLYLTSSFQHLPQKISPCFLKNPTYAISYCLYNKGKLCSTSENPLQIL